MTPPINGSTMLPYQQLVQQYPNYNHQSVVSQTPPDPSLHASYVYSQPPSPGIYAPPMTLSHDHGYYKSPTLYVQSLPPASGSPGPMLPQHADGMNTYQSHHGLSHVSPSSSPQSSLASTPVSPQNEGVSSQNGSVQSSVSSNILDSGPSTAYSNVPNHYQMHSSSSYKSTHRSSGSSFAMPYTTVRNRKSKTRHHSISSSGSCETVVNKRVKNKNAHVSKTQNPNKIPLVNRFSPLAQQVENEDTENDMGTDDDLIDDEEIVAPKVKVPPIFVSKKCVTVGQLLHCLKSISTDFSLKDSKDFLRIDCGSPDVYRSYCPVLDKQNIEYHTYRLPQDKTIDVVVKHVPTDFTDEEVGEELKALGFADFKLMRVWGKDKKPIPVISLYLKNNGKNEEIYSVDKLLNCIVLVEPKKKFHNIPQCANCQRYGHTKNYCKLSPRCMFCTDAHPSAECDKMVGEEAIKLCVNCGENHSANYRGCKYYAELKSKRFKDRPQVPHRATHFSNAPPDLSEFPQLGRSQPSAPAVPTVARDHSYAGITRTSAALQNQPPPHNFSMPHYESTAPPPGPSISSAPVMDSLMDTLITALKPFFMSLLAKIKPMLQVFLIQLLNGSH